MKLLTFEASDLEKGGSSGKAVDCILCLKGYCVWKQSGGIGLEIWWNCENYVLPERITIIGSE
ncbi:hypothetical protein Pfo_014537 [Paulownia fortunei]|nr:hypothetical protein Pfo_014537 [Paulownia fortunei]